MNKCSLLVCLIIIACGCSKKSSNNSNPTAPAMVFSLNGLTDVTVSQNVDTTFYLTLAANYISGPQEAITITPDSLPGGFTVSPSHISGTPTFGAVFTIHANVPSSGTFPILIVTSTATGKKSFHFNLIVSGNPFSYSVASLPDITVPQYVHTVVPVYISTTLTGGLPETVTATPGAIPSGISISPATISGSPSFSSPFSLNMQFNTAGTHPISISTSSASTATKTLNFNVIVAPSSNCAPLLDAIYTSTTTCTPTSPYDGVLTNQGITAAATNKVYVQLPNTLGVATWLNCSAGTFTSDPGVMTDGTTTISAGSGTFNDHTVVSHYTITKLSVNYTCTSTFSR